MNQRTSAPVLIALMLAAAAPVSGQSPDTPVRDSAAAVPGVDLRSSSWLSERKVVNDNGEEIANVSDLILDRGSGRIEFLVINTGTTLGLGGRSVAIPYGAFRWESGKDRFVLASTGERLKQFPEFSAKSWAALMESKQDDSSTLRLKLATEAASPSDPYAGHLDTAKSARVEGVIKKVERVRTSTFGEQVEITVQAADGTTRRIALGPSWYINGTPAAPMRGDKVTVDALALPRDLDQLLAGTEIRNGERELHLRDSDGSPAWALKSVESGGHSYSTPYSRYLLLTQLPGMKVDCRGNECGAVHEVVLDRSSGEVAFLSIDPNENFLGISDTKRLIPWSVATVTLEGTVRIDASKEMVLASPETPADLSTLNSGPLAERVYKAFDVPAPRFEPRKRISAVVPATDDAWSARGLVVTGIETNSVTTMSGTVSDMTEVKFEGGVQSARAMKIKLAGGDSAEELVLLGPTVFMKNQKTICHAGDSVKVDACRTTIDGRRYWIAKSLECKDMRVVLLDGNNVPAWAQP